MFQDFCILDIVPPQAEPATLCRRHKM